MNDGVRVAIGPQSLSALIANFTFNLPQVIAVIVVLASSTDEPSCDRPLRLWASLHAIHLVGVMLVNTVLYANRQFAPGELPPPVRNAARTKSALDLFGFAWFVVANVWVFQSANCEQVAPNVYKLCFWLVIVTYISILLPCLIVLALIPIACFCLPCLLRMLQRLNDPQRGRGATNQQIDRITTVPYAQGLIPEGEDASCAICLTDFEDGEQLRQLPCRHYFHKACIDDWLRINATCPRCRAVVIETPGLARGGHGEGQEFAHLDQAGAAGAAAAAGAAGSPTSARHTASPGSRGRMGYAPV
mmetsp:Transcript_23097/g.74286  ORF Transcript_23097/g.74286 Transcript_23097/m.74286 type:complete len:303 (-) Transcript_23097:124-1032(-)